MNSSPLAAASSAGVHIESRWISPIGWKPPITQTLPPKTTKFWPVTSEASSVARKVTSWATLRGSHSSNPSVGLGHLAEEVLGHPGPGPRARSS